MEPDLHSKTQRKLRKRQKLTDNSIDTNMSENHTSISVPRITRKRKTVSPEATERKTSLLVQESYKETQENEDPLFSMLRKLSVEIAGVQEGSKKENVLEVVHEAAQKISLDYKCQIERIDPSENTKRRFICKITIGGVTIGTGKAYDWWTTKLLAFENVIDRIQKPFFQIVSRKDSSKMLKASHYPFSNLPTEYSAFSDCQKANATGSKEGTADTMSSTESTEKDMSLMEKDSNIKSAPQIDCLRNEYESNVEWGVRRKFLQANWDTLPEDRLVCLSNCYLNMTFYGCSYPPAVTQEIIQRSNFPAEDVVAAKSRIEKVPFVKSSESLPEEASKAPGVDEEVLISKLKKLAVVLQEKARILQSLTPLAIIRKVNKFSPSKYKWKYRHTYIDRPDGGMFFRCKVFLDEVRVAVGEIAPKKKIGKNLALENLLEKIQKPFFKVVTKKDNSKKLIVSEKPFDDLPTDYPSSSDEDDFDGLNPKEALTVDRKPHEKSDRRMSPHNSEDKTDEMSSHEDMPEDVSNEEEHLYQDLLNDPKVSTPDDISLVCKESNFETVFLQLQKQQFQSLSKFVVPSKPVGKNEKAASVLEKSANSCHMLLEFEFFLQKNSMIKCVVKIDNHVVGEADGDSLKKTKEAASAVVLTRLRSKC